MTLKQQQDVLAAYRSGRTRRTRDYREPGPITAPVDDYEGRPARAFYAVREVIGDSCYRLGHLPTADEQASLDHVDDE